MVTRVGPGDEEILHDVAAATFRLACPPGTTEENIRRFIETSLSVEAFAGYLASDRHRLFVARLDGDVVGYAVAVLPPVDPTIAPLLRQPDSLELSKIYVLESAHGSGVADALMDSVVEVATSESLPSIWLGVNQANERANRFYRRHGFEVVGEREFQVGDRMEQDFVRERLL